MNLKYDLTIERSDPETGEVKSIGLIGYKGETSSNVVTSETADMPINYNTMRATESGGTYDISAAGDYGRVAVKSFMYGAGQESYDTTSAHPEKFWESWGADISEDGVYKLGTALDTMYSSSTLSPVIHSVGNYLCVARATGGSPPYVVAYTTTFGPGATFTNLGFNTTAPTHPCIAMESAGTVLYASFGLDGIWMSVPPGNFSKLSTEQNIRLLKHSGGYLYGAKGTPPTTDLVSGGWINWTTGEYTRLSPVFVDYRSPVALMNILASVYLVVSYRGETTMYRMIYDPTDTEPPWQEVQDFPQGFTATSAIAYLNRIYIGGFFGEESDSLGKGTIYVWENDTINLLAEVGEHTEDWRIMSMAANERWVYFVAHSKLWRIDARTNGYSHVDNIPLPTASVFTWDRTETMTSKPSALYGCTKCNLSSGGYWTHTHDNPVNADYLVIDNTTYSGQLSMYMTNIYTDSEVGRINHWWSKDAAITSTGGSIGYTLKSDWAGGDQPSWGSPCGGYFRIGLYDGSYQTEFSLRRYLDFDFCNMYVRVNNGEDGGAQVYIGELSANQDHEIILTLNPTTHSSLLYIDGRLVRIMLTHNLASSTHTAGYYWGVDHDGYPHKFNYRIDNLQIDATPYGTTEPGTIAMESRANNVFVDVEGKELDILDDTTQPIATLELSKTSFHQPSVDKFFRSIDVQHNGIAGPSSKMTCQYKLDGKYYQSAQIYDGSSTPISGGVASFDVNKPGKEIQATVILYGDGTNNIEVTGIVYRFLSTGRVSQEFVASLMNGTKLRNGQAYDQSFKEVRDTLFNWQRNGYVLTVTDDTGSYEAWLNKVVESVGNYSDQANNGYEGLLQLTLRQLA